jgi:16S rRNA (cytosine967-C5)-methyltransferase
MSMNARETALYALSSMRQHHIRSEEALHTALVKAGKDTAGAQDMRDASLASRIVYGVIQNRLFIDGCIAAYSSVKLQKLHPQVLDILRLSVYQLLFLSKIPVNAAVNEGVALTKKNANPRAAGLVNAVLRRIAEDKERLLTPEAEENVQQLSLRYSHPEWLVAEFAGRLGLGETSALLQAHNGDTAVTVRVNTLRSDINRVSEALTSGGTEVTRHWLDGSMELRGTHRLDRLAAFSSGDIYVQDPAAALAVIAADPKPGMLVVDGCASPGGKSITAAVLMQNSGRILSCDVSEQKLRRIRENADRAGVTCIETCLQDAQNPYTALYDKADIVLADVPCSGIGVIRKKPEIRYKEPAEIKALPALQLAIIKGLSRCVRPGGLLLYSTCTLLKSENEEVVGAFLRDNTDFSPEAFRLPDPAGDAPEGMLTLWPHRHATDGFFIARLRRRA